MRTVFLYRFPLFGTGFYNWGESAAERCQACEKERREECIQKSCFFENGVINLVVSMSEVEEKNSSTDDTVEIDMSGETADEENSGSSSPSPVESGGGVGGVLAAATTTRSTRSSARLSGNKQNKNTHTIRVNSLDKLGYLWLKIYEEASESTFGAKLTNARTGNQIPLENKGATLMDLGIKNKATIILTRPTRKFEKKADKLLREVSGRQGEGGAKGD